MVYSFSGPYSNHQEQTSLLHGTLIHTRFTSYIQFILCFILIQPLPIFLKFQVFFLLSVTFDMNLKDFNLDQLIIQTSNLHCLSNTFGLSTDDNAANEIAHCSYVRKIISTKTIPKNVVKAILKNAWKINNRWTLKE